MLLLPTATPLPLPVLDEMADRARRVVENAFGIITIAFGSSEEPYH